MMEDGAEMEQCATSEGGKGGGGEPRHTSSEGVCANTGALEQVKTFTESDMLHMQSTSLSADDAMHVQSEELCAVETTNDCSLVSPLQQLDPAQLVESADDVQHIAEHSNPRLVGVDPLPNVRDVPYNNL